MTLLVNTIMAIFNYNILVKFIFFDFFGFQIEDKIDNYSCVRVGGCS